MVATDRVREIYERHVRSLPDAERLQLLALVADELTRDAAPPDQQPQRSLMELHGLGKEIWEGVDPDEYVRELRGEWGHRPAPGRASHARAAGDEPLPYGTRSHTC